MALQNNNVENKWVQIPLAAASAGTALSFVLSPAELIKCRLQAHGPSFYRNSWDCIQKTVQAEGLRGLTRGLGATLLCVTRLASRLLVWQALCTAKALSKSSCCAGERYRATSYSFRRMR